MTEPNAMIPTDAPATRPDSPLPISETFLSIQGEGKLTGVPSYFIRTSGCNLRCTWCDTPYASWKPEGAPRTIDSLVSDTIASRAHHAVLTGGEPMIFDAIEPLATALRAAGIHITVETAATVFRPFPIDLVSMSPKLANSTPPPGDPRDPLGVWRTRHEERRRRPDVVQSFIDQARHGGTDLQLKFVVAAPADLAEIDAQLGEVHGWRPDDVLLMPEGVAIPAPGSTGWIVEECVRRGWRYCQRLHIELFGHTRGT